MLSEPTRRRVEHPDGTVRYKRLTDSSAAVFRERGYTVTAAPLTATPEVPKPPATDPEPAPKPEPVPEPKKRGGWPKGKPKPKAKAIETPPNHKMLGPEQNKTEAPPANGSGSGEDEKEPTDG